MSTEAITIATQETKTELSAAEASIAMLAEFIIASPEDSEFAAEILRDVKAKAKEIEAKRTAITKPLLTAKREVDALFKPVKEALALAEATLKDKIAGYLESVEDANAAAVTAAGAAETAEEASTALATVEAVQSPTGVSVRHTWEPRICNEEMLDRRFLSPDMSKIREWMKEHQDAEGEPLPIPGVLFDKKRIVASRA